MDIARWAIPGATLPTKVWSLGGRFGYEDQGQTPNTQMAVMDFGDTLLVFEVRGLVDKPERTSPFKFKVANEYYTTEGMIANGKFYPKSGGKPEKLARFDVKVTPGGAWGSFLHAVRSRKVGGLQRRRARTATTPAPGATWPTSPTAWVRRSRSTARRRRSATTAKSSRRSRTCGEPQGVGVRLEETTYQLGRTLTLDPETERSSAKARTKPTRS